MDLIRKFWPVVIVAGLTTSCTTPTPTPTPTPGPDVPKILASVETQTKNICKFVPNVTPIVNLIPTFGGIASDIANAICAAVKNAPGGAAAGSSGQVVVRDVTVTGVFVR